MAEPYIIIGADAVPALENTVVGEWPAAARDPRRPIKWQSRRVVVPQPSEGVATLDLLDDQYWGSPAQPGDRWESSFGLSGAEIPIKEGWRLMAPAGHSPHIEYRDGTARAITEELASRWQKRGVWISPDDMPRWAARYMARVMATRAERLQAISPADVAAEGIETRPDEGWNGVGYRDVITGGFHHAVGDDPLCTCRNGRRLALEPHRCAYRVAWNRLNQRRGYPWGVDPLVFVCEYQRIA